MYSGPTPSTSLAVGPTDSSATDYQDSAVFVACGTTTEQVSLMYAAFHLFFRRQSVQKSAEWFAQAVQERLVCSIRAHPTDCMWPSFLYPSINGSHRLELSLPTVQYSTMQFGSWRDIVAVQTSLRGIRSFLERCEIGTFLSLLAKSKRRAKALHLTTTSSFKVPSAGVRRIFAVAAERRVIRSQLLSRKRDGRQGFYRETSLYRGTCVNSPSQRRALPQCLSSEP